jgi:hypothetical protein
VSIRDMELELTSSSIPIRVLCSRSRRQDICHAVGLQHWAREDDTFVQMLWMEQGMYAYLNGIFTHSCVVDDPCKDAQ